MNIRPVKREDVEACAKIYIQSYNQPPWNYGWTEEKAVKYLNEYMDTKQFIGFVLCEGEEIVAGMFGHSKTWWTNDMLFIDELFVSPAKQGAGYGQKIMSYTEEYCRESGLTSISLMTNKFMPAYKFYNKIDFILADQFVFMFKVV